MSEERAVGARLREEPFGRVVLHSYMSWAVYSLDLYETHEPYAPGLAFKGYLLPGRSRDWPGTVPVGVELSIDDAAFNAIYETIGGSPFFGGEGGYWEPDAPNTGDFELGGPWRDVSPIFHAKVSAPLRLPDRTVWTGTLLSTDGEVRGRFDFLLEQYGTIEPVILPLVALLLVLLYDGDATLKAEECYHRALRQCGDAGNIKSINMTKGITGMTLHVNSGCQIECFERWYPSAHEGVAPPREDSP